MDNETILEKSWLKRNWRWALPLVGIILSGIAIILSLVPSDSASDFTTAFRDEALYANAVERSNENKEVLNTLGTLEPVGNMAILESNVEYSDNNKSVNLSVRVKGDKGKGRMDVKASKKENMWQYSLIKIRIKDPEKEIVVLE